MRSIELKTNNYEKYELAFIDMNQYGTSTPCRGLSRCNDSGDDRPLDLAHGRTSRNTARSQITLGQHLALFEMLNSLSGTSSSTYIKWTDRQTTNGN